MNLTEAATNTDPTTSSACTTQQGAQVPSATTNGPIMSNNTAHNGNTVNGTTVNGNIMDAISVLNNMQRVMPLIQVPADDDISHYTNLDHRTKEQQIMYLVDLTEKICDPEENEQYNPGGRPIPRRLRNQFRRRQQLLQHFQVPREEVQVDVLQNLVNAYNHFVGVAPAPVPQIRRVSPKRKPNKEEHTDSDTDSVHTESDVSSDDDPAPDQIKQVNAMSGMFWGLIRNLHWANASDLKMNLLAIKNQINSFRPTIKMTFRVVYKQYADALMNKLNTIFVDRNLKEDEQKIIVSHVIGLGSEWYENIMDSPQMVEFLIDQNECQNFLFCIDLPNN